MGPGPRRMQVRTSSRQLANRPGTSPKADSVSGKARITDENTAPDDTTFTTLRKRSKLSQSLPSKRQPLEYPQSGNEVKNHFELVIEPIVDDVGSSPTEQSTVFSAARKLFHRSAPARIIGRSQERATIEAFWKGSVLDQDSSRRILYICGTPGTGKTALLHEILPSLVDSSVRIIERNCMMFEGSGDVLFELNCEILGDERFSRQQCVAKSENVCRAIKKRLTEVQAKRTLLILDEIDNLANTDRGLLEKIFHWADDCSCSIIGIANSIDLTTRYVPASIQHLAQTLYFAPYQVEDIVAILTDRMERANVGGRLIEPLAIELCSRKVASTGDLRKALEIIQIAFDVAQEKGCEQINIQHVVAAMDRTLTGSTKREENSLVAPLNMNARMVLVTFIIFQDENPAPVGTRLPYKKPTLQNIFDRYVQLLSISAGKAGTLMQPVSRDEFLLLLTSLETFGVVSVSAQASKRGGKKQTSFLDWPTTLIKLSVADRPALVRELKQGGITRLFLL